MQGKGRKKERDKAAYKRIWPGGRKYIGEEEERKGVRKCI